MTTQDNRTPIRIDLTPAQQAQVLTETGKSAEAIEFTAAELEERIAPRRPLLEM